MTNAEALARVAGARVGSREWESAVRTLTDDQAVQLLRAEPDPARRAWLRDELYRRGLSLAAAQRGQVRRRG